MLFFDKISRGFHFIGTSNDDSSGTINMHINKLMANNLEKDTQFFVSLQPHIDKGLHLKFYS